MNQPLLPTSNYAWDTLELAAKTPVMSVVTKDKHPPGH
jgi:hypothetical protein